MTGATGFIGSQLLNELLDDFEVYALVKKDAFYNKVLPRDVGLVSGDITEPELGAKIKDIKPELVVHLASLTPVRFSFERTMDYGRVNYLGTVNLVEAVLRLGSVRQFVHASTVEVYRSRRGLLDEDDPLEGGTPYGVSKAAADLYVQVAGKSWGLPYTIMRCGNTFGRAFTLPEEARGYLVEKAVISMLKGGSVVRFDGFPDKLRSWMYYTDHVGAYLKVIGNKGATGRAFNAAAWQSSVGEMVEEVRSLTGYQGEIRWGANPRPNDPEALVEDTGRMGSLGWMPKVGRREALSRTVEYWKSKLG